MCEHTQSEGNTVAISFDIKVGIVCQIFSGPKGKRGGVRAKQRKRQIYHRIGQAYKNKHIHTHTNILVPHFLLC